MESKFEKIKQDVELLENLDSEDPRLVQYFKSLETIFHGQIPWLDKERLAKANASLLSVDQNIAGGVLSFAECPETQEILQVKEKLLGPGGIFLSCLYIDDNYRGRGLWKKLIKKEIDKADINNTFVWGLTNNTKLADLYKDALGAEIHDINNGLYLVKFTKDNYLKIEDGKEL